MANYNVFAAGTSIPVDGLGKHFLLKNLVNAYNSVAEGGVGTLSYSGNTFSIFQIKEGWFVKRIWVRIVKLASTAAVLTAVGDTENAAYWITTDLEVGTGGTVNTAAGDIHGTDHYAALLGKLFTADDEITITFGTANFDGKLEFVMEVVDVFGGNTIV